MPERHAYPVDDPDRYVGLSVDAARDLALEAGWGRVREVTGEDVVITLEWLADRVNFHVRDGTVVKCWFH